MEKYVAHIVKKNLGYNRKNATQNPKLWNRVIERR